MQHILLVSSDTGHQALVEKAIDRENCSIIALIETSANLAAELRSRAIDMVLMDLDDHGEAELEAIRQGMENKPLPVVMFVRQGNRESAANATAYVVDGLQADRVAPILAAVVTRFPESFQECFTSWIRSLSGIFEGLVAIDGKTLRRSRNRLSSKEAIIYWR